MLNRVPCSGDWEHFPSEYLEMRDLAYLSAKTGHEFAILRGKNQDILFHGDRSCCKFDGLLFEQLKQKHYVIYGHSHPNEEDPVPSPQDRMALEIIGQHFSKLISGMTGREITYTANMFDDIL